MNRALSPGDRGHRSQHPRRPLRPRRSVLGAGGLKRGVADIVGPKEGKPPGERPGGRCRRDWQELGFQGIGALATLVLDGCELQPHLLPDGGAGHIMHMLRNLSRFTINGSICSGRVFLSCVECGARTGTVWYASRQKETPLPSPPG